MKEIILKFVHACPYLFLAVSCFGQSGQPTPTPSDDVVKISTSLIQIDVTVTDKNGKLITDLKPEDFEIFENDEKQEITNFSFVSASSDVSMPMAKKNPKDLPPGLPLKSEQVRRTVALIVDDLTLNSENIYFVRKSLRKFVDEQMQDGDLVAIARTGGSIGILEQFTSDRRQLYAAIEKIKWNPFGTGGNAVVMPELPKLPGDQIGRRDADKEAEKFRQGIIAARTISGLNYIVSGMKNLPGRKSAILFSEGFKIFNKDITGFEKDLRLSDALEKLFDSAARASVAVYTVDARGLEPNPDENFFDQQDGLTYLAEQTGGISIKNSNDLNLGIEKILNVQKGYYLIGYTPDGDTFDAAKHRFNKLTLKIKREAATARYRSGFFGVSGEENKKPVNSNPIEQLKTALSSPFAASGIGLNLNMLFGSDGKQDSFVRSILHINAKDLKFTDQNGGGKKAIFDVLAISFSDDGTPVDKIIKNYTLIIPAKEYEKFLAEGFVYNFTLPVKKPGAYQFRVAIRDKQSEKIGSASQYIEVPNLKKNELTISGVTLENLTRQQWQKEAQMAQSNPDLEKTENQSVTNLFTDTALRRFKRSTILRYNFEVYNAKPGEAQKPQLTAQIKVFRGEKLFLEGNPQPLDLTGQTDWRKIASSGALSPGSEMLPGDYVLQILVTDNSAKEKGKVAVQFVQFEIAE